MGGYGKMPTKTLLNFKNIHIAFLIEAVIGASIICFTLYLDRWLSYYVRQGEMTLQVKILIQFVILVVVILLFLYSFRFVFGYGQSLKA